MRNKIVINISELFHFNGITKFFIHDTLFFAGFYRVKYDNATLKLIVDDLDSPDSKIDTLNKAQVRIKMYSYNLRI